MRKQRRTMTCLTRRWETHTNWREMLKENGRFYVPQIKLFRAIRLFSRSMIASRRIISSASPTVHTMSLLLLPSNVALSPPSSIHSHSKVGYDDCISPRKACQVGWSWRPCFRCCQHACKLFLGSWLRGPRRFIAIVVGQKSFMDTL